MTTSSPPDPVLVKFCELVRDRSAENQRAFKTLKQDKLFGPALAIVRQELDSLIRVLYLLAIPSRSARRRLILASVEGRHWTRKTAAGKSARITDREMVDSALRLHPWIKQVYAFGCNLIHLSDWHAYNRADPTAHLPPPERISVLHQIEAYHGKKLGPLSFRTLLMHAPYAIEKIGSNLECYLKDLEKR